MEIEKVVEWLSRDPLPNAEMSQGPNLYDYVANNPVDLSDPLGLASGRGNPNGPKCPCGQHLASGFPNGKAATNLFGDLNGGPQNGYYVAAGYAAAQYIPGVNYVVNSWITLSIIYASPALFAPICVPN